LAPLTTRSLTVPETDNLPKSPPGKKRGKTIKESVEKAREELEGENRKASAKLTVLFFLKYLKKMVSRSSRVKRPPSP